MTLDLTLAEKAVAKIAAPLGLEPEAMAQGILDIVNARMADAIRTITIRRGIDPRDFSLFAYGGAGPMHAVALAEELEIGEVIVPVHPGAFSAWGMLQTDVKHELKQTWSRALGQCRRSGVGAAYRDLEARAASISSARASPTTDIAFRPLAPTSATRGRSIRSTAPCPAAGSTRRPSAPPSMTPTSASTATPIPRRGSRS